MTTALFIITLIVTLSVGVGAVMMVVGLVTAPDGAETENGFQYAPASKSDTGDLAGTHLHAA